MKKAVFSLHILLRVILIDNRQNVQKLYKNIKQKIVDSDNEPKEGT